MLPATQELVRVQVWEREQLAALAFLLDAWFQSKLVVMVEKYVRLRAQRIGRAVLIRSECPRLWFCHDWHVSGDRGVRRQRE